MNKFILISCVFYTLSTCLYGADKYVTWVIAKEIIGTELTMQVSYNENVKTKEIWKFVKLRRGKEVVYTYFLDGVTEPKYTLDIQTNVLQLYDENAGKKTSRGSLYLNSLKKNIVKDKK